MAERGRAHTVRASFGSGWRAWIVALAIVLPGAAVGEVFCHELHDADQECVACLLRHQPAAEPSGSVSIGFTDVAHPFEPADCLAWIAPGHLHSFAARGPPA